ncbi:hypothetical protein WR25_02464 isoform D [Diploscapter pachys]|uniref:Cadherin domain-containing protein n=1 Tax=Diploscapter pachys TaxID=2018661 RepID=A0A2A2KKQ8_9BILA|nr:hypothetical protein WR25_02464 isoform D [Diploscapter pachys]
MSYVSFSAASGSRSFRLTEMRNGPRLLGVLLLAAASCHFGHASSNKHYKHRVPIIDLRGAEQFVATVQEEENVVSTVPDLAIIPETGPVCSYAISSVDDFVPFEVQVVDRYSGSAIIRVKDAATLDCNKPEYTLTLSAVRCDDEATRSEPVTLRITVKDTNNHAPEFDNPWYTFTVEEGKKDIKIAVLNATDKDCGHPFGEICEYEITNGLKELPFSIDNQGVLRNTAPLNYSHAKSYILTIVANDCGMRKSKSALVTVHVKEACLQGLHNTPEKVIFTPGNGNVRLLPNAETHFCDKTSCDVDHVELTASLQSTGGKTICTPRTAFNNDSMQSCAINPQTADLLQDVQSNDSAEKNEVAPADSWQFDGSKAYVVNPNKIKDLIPDKFTLSFAMRHERGSKEEQNNKQNILCESDHEGMNRHHFNVYIRHCKLEVVLRREAGSSPEFRAAEWRWSVPQVCDGEWHSYSLMFNSVDDTHLVIDGEIVKASERNPEILDDWPLHKPGVAKTRLTIGACWHGRQQTFVQHLRAQVASMHLLTGQTESTKAIECLHQCPEHLQYNGMDEMREGMSTSFNKEQTSVTLKAKSIEDMQKMIRKLAYSNNKDKPLMESRDYLVQSKVVCKGNTKIALPDFTGKVVIEKEEKLTLSLSGSATVKTDQTAVKTGTPMIPDIRITISQTDKDGNEQDVTDKHKLDYCKVHLKPSRDMDLEYFSSPASLIASLNIEFEHDKEGITLSGDDEVSGYRDILSKIHYFNTRPETYSKRLYSIQCGMRHGRIASNEMLVSMTIDPVPMSSPASSALHLVPPPAVASVPSVPSSAESAAGLDSLELIERHFEPAFDQLGASRLQNILEMDLPRPKALLSHHGFDSQQGAIAGGAVAVVVVVCVGFLLVLLVIGVLKMRDTPIPSRRRKNKRQDDGMHWDDSGMNITVNPLEDMERGGGQVAEEEYSEDDEESSDNER